jgi:CRP-like cAMP-binding protein
MEVELQEVQRLPLFAGIDARDAAEALAAFVPAHFGPGELLVAEGESDRSMILVLDGELSVTVGDPPTELARLGRGEVVGEMTLLGILNRRAATVRTVAETRMLILDADGLAHLRKSASSLVAKLEVSALNTLARRLRETDRRIAALAKGSPLQVGRPQGLWARLAAAFGGKGGAPQGPAPTPEVVLSESVAFRNQSPEATLDLASQLQVEPVSQGTTIVEEGAMGGDAFVIGAGEVGVYRATRDERYEKLATLSEGSLFGLAALIDGQARTATCVASTPVWLLRISGDLFREISGSAGPAGRVFRRAVVEAMSGQLRLANSHLEALEHDARIAGGRNLGHLQAARAAVE